MVPFLTQKILLAAHSRTIFDCLTRCQFTKWKRKEGWRKAGECKKEAGINSYNEKEKEEQKRERIRIEKNRLCCSGRDMIHSQNSWKEKSGLYVTALPPEGGKVNKNELG